MTKQRFILTAVALAAVFGTVVVAQCVWAAESGSLPARMDTFTHPDGGNYFALSLEPKGDAPSATPRDVVVLFNTSASQIGEYRTKALDALQGILAGLGPQDRVQLVAIDLNAVPLTKTFVAPSGKEMTAAVAALNARVPLGATDMKKVLNAAVESFKGDSKNGRSIVYLGDGRSAANIVGPQEFEAISQKLATSHISVFSYIVGARPDPQIFGALAGKTGGVLVEYNRAPLDPQDALKMSPAELAKAETAAEKIAIVQLAAAVKAPVLWPTSVKWPAEMTEVFPKQAPPLRLDRDTVVVGKFEGKGPFEVQYEVAGSNGPQKLAFTAAPAEAAGDTNSYLANLVKWAEKDNGVPLIGTQSLQNAKLVAARSTLGAKELAKQALSSGNTEGAAKLAEAALRQDPNNVEAQNVKDAAEKLLKKGPTVKNMSAQKLVDGPVAAAEPPVAPADKAVAPETLPPAGGATELNLVGPSGPVDAPNAGAFLEDVEHRSNVITQQAQAEVRAVVDQARRQVGADPKASMNGLRLELEKIRQVPEINPDVRDQLVGQLQSALQETARRQKEFDRLNLLQQERLASAIETQQVLEGQLQGQMKVKQLMNRFNSLMSEGRYNMAEMQSVAEAEKILPRSSALVAAKLTARNSDYFYTAMALRQARQKGVVDALSSVERSHIPFNDMEPIVYPDAEFWRRISDKDNPDSRVNKYSTMDLAKPSSAETEIQQALREQTPPFEFTEMALSDVVDYIKDYVKNKHPAFEIQLDAKALSDLGITPETTVSKNVKGISLRSSLRLLLKDLGLTYMIKDEVLLITSPDTADNSLTTKVYPVADLVIPVQSNMMGGMMGGMGGMSGMGGGMSGMGGGMGGMGGGMGGMGGMGGGMGGMGMFNTPREMLPRMNQNGFQAFSVKDDLSKPVPPAKKTDAKNEKPAPAKEKEEVPASVNAAVSPKAATENVEKIQLEFAAGEKPEVVWDKFFSTHNPSQASVRDAVRRLMNDAKYDHVIALIGAALIHQQPQPWMHEAMCLAMQAADRPQEEIERAVMSAVDFAQTPADLTYVGAYLMNMGYYERALEVFREVSIIDPMLPEPYMLGLKAARKTGNLDGLRWASVGILSQAWPKEQVSVWKAGVGVAEEVLEKLKAENRTQELAAFRAELDKAVERDCAVIVNYTGDAQLDLMVQEPTGSVCSYRLPRTKAGGMLLGDSIAQTNTDNGGGKSEVYVCPKGFNGTYKIAIQRVFGNVTTGKVHVKVITHYRSKNCQSMEKTIPLIKDEAKVVFDLKDGRRTDPIADQQIAIAAAGQMQLNSLQAQLSPQVLGQVIDNSVSQSAMNSLGNSLYGGNGQGGLGGLGGLGGFPVNRGAVGYMPKITQYTEGAMLMVTAVVSADRRYVRISPTPYFSGIGQVNTFNSFTGQSGTSDGGTGGQGYGGLSGGSTQGSTGSFGNSGF